jgi:hypothetical protein
MALHKPVALSKWEVQVRHNPYFSLFLSAKWSSLLIDCQINQLIKEIAVDYSSMTQILKWEIAFLFRILEEDGHGILEGISSLHSWIKTQTMIRPTKLNSRKDGGAK